MSGAYKTAKAVDEVNAKQFFHNSCNPRRREDLVKFAYQFKTNEGQHCFAQSTLCIWNLLALKVVETDRTRTFRKALGKFIDNRSQTDFK